MLYLVYDVI